MDRTSTGNGSMESRLRNNFHFRGDLFSDGMCRTIDDTRQLARRRRIHSSDTACLSIWSDLYSAEARSIPRLHSSLRNFSRAKRGHIRRCASWIHVQFRELGMELVTIAAAFILVWLGGFFCGISALLAYMIWRLMRNMDDSNINNATRLLSHVVLHPMDFARMYFLSKRSATIIKNAFPDINLHRPFWYVWLDEFEGVVKSRPEK